MIYFYVPLPILSLSHLIIRAYQVLAVWSMAANLVYRMREILLNQVRKRAWMVSPQVAGTHFLC